MQLGQITAAAAARPPAPPLPGTGLCLSGGGYRAMLFHAGALTRLNEAALLARVARISSVSGGSLAAATLARHWSDLQIEHGVARGLDVVTDRLLAFSTRRVDLVAWLRGILTPGESPASELARWYRRYLVSDMRLSDLPEAPVFVFCATNLSTGSLVRFERTYVADYQVGAWMDPDLPVALAVAASSAFPPALSPLRLAMPLDDRFGDDRPVLHHHPYTAVSTLCDGGVYDNLGVQPILGHEELLISDAGAPFRPRPGPPIDWLRQTLWAWHVTIREVRARRHVEFIDAVASGERMGAAWHTTAHLAAGQPGVVLPVDPAWTERLATVHTRLWPIAPRTARRLVNLGYAAADASVRAHLDRDLADPAGWPYPELGLDRPPAAKAA